jgi:hypothetical protein
MPLTSEEIRALRQRCRLPQSRVAWDCSIPLPNYNRFELSMGKLTATKQAEVEAYLRAAWARIIEEVRATELPPQQVAL